MFNITQVTNSSKLIHGNKLLRVKPSKLNYWTVFKNKPALVLKYEITNGTLFLQLVD